MHFGPLLLRKEENFLSGQFFTVNPLAQLWERADFEQRMRRDKTG